MHFQRDLEEANKLIFIRNYAAAKEILARLLAEHKDKFAAAPALC